MKLAISLLFVALSISVVYSQTDCAVAIVDLLPAGIELLDDINNGDYTKLSTDIDNALPQVGQAAETCTGFTPKSNCDSEVQALKPSYLQVAKDVTVQDIPQLTKDIEAVVPATNQAVLDCTGLVITSDCSDKLVSLIEPASLIVKDVKAGDYTDLENAISEFLPDARIAVGVCTGHDVSDTCQNDIDGLVPVINAVVSDFANGNIGNLVHDLTQIIPAINSLSTDCFGHKITISCETKLAGLIPVGLQIYNDIQAHNYDQLEKDLQAADPQIEAALASCLFGAPYNPTESSVSTDTCGEKLEVIVPYLEKIYTYASEQDYQNVFDQVSAANKPINKAIDVCLSFNDSSSSESLETMQGANLNACISAAKEVVSIGQTVAEEVSEHNYAKAVDTVLAALPQVESDFQECLGF